MADTLDESLKQLSDRCSKNQRDMWEMSRKQCASKMETPIHGKPKMK